MPLNPTISRERITVLANANVLYSNDQRNILMTFGVERVIRLRWTDEIEAEWVENLVRNNPGVFRENIERTCRRMQRRQVTSCMKSSKYHRMSQA
jgi:hypothetical protein